MAQPPAYYRSKDFTEDFGHETDHSALNAELDTASNSINDIRTNLAILQADDGKLRPSVVTADSISYELRVGLVEGVVMDAQAMLDRSLEAANASSVSAASAEASRVSASNLAAQMLESAHDLAAQALERANAAEDSAIQADLSAGCAQESAESAQAVLDQLRGGQVTPDWLATEGKAEILNKPTNLDEYGVLDEVKEISSSGVPVGMIVTFAMQAPPPKYLVANGALLSRGAYPELYAAIGTTYDAGDGSTTFGIPDLRGEFVRGWDGGRGVDAGRVFSSLQGSQNLSHNHTISDPGHAHTIYDPGHAHSINIGVYTGQKTWLLKDGYNPATYSTNTAVTGIGIYAAATGVTAIEAGGTESRPRNVALLICIKYE